MTGSPGPEPSLGVPRRLRRLVTALGLVGVGVLVASLGIGRRHSQGLPEDLAQLTHRMAEAQAQQQQLLQDLRATQQALEAAQTRLREQEAVLSHRRAELLARQGAIEAHGRELGESLDELRAAVQGMAGEEP